MRPIDNHDPEPLPGDDADTISNLDRQVEESPAALATQEPEGAPTGAMDSEAYAQWLRAAHASQLAQFEAIVAEIVEQGAQRMREARQALGVDKRYRIEDTKFTCQEAPTLTPSGEIDQHAPGAHLTAGITLGLFTDAVTGAWPSLIDHVLGRGERPFLLEPVGRKKENAPQQELLERLLDRQLDDANWHQVMEQILRDLPRFGTAVARQSWCAETALVPDNDDYNVLREVVTREGLSLTHWPLLNVYVSDPAKPWAEDQTTVIWSSQQTLGELERHERVLDLQTKIEVDPVTGQPVPVPLPIVRGRFVNLEVLRRMQAEDLHQRFEDASQRSNSTLDRDALSMGAVSAWERLDVLELQGAFPMGTLLRAGLITPELLRYYGTELLDDQGQLLSGEAAARVADRLVWYITTVKGKNGTSGTLEPGAVIECHPCPYRRPRTELLAARYVPNGSSFYGLSADAIGGPVGDQADATLNDVAEIIGNNAKPPTFIRAQAFTDADAKNMIFENGKTYTVEGGVPTEEAVKYLLKPYDEHMDGLVSTLTDIYTTRTMVSQASKGAPAITGTGTLGEAQQQVSQGERRLLSICKMAAQSLKLKSILYLLQDLDWFLDDERFAEQARRIAGEAGMDAESILPTAADTSGQRASLADSYLVKDPGMATMPREVASQLLMNIAAAGADLPTLNREAIYRDAIAMTGKDPDAYFIDVSAPTSPDRELKMIISGDRPEVNEREDALNVHLPAHRMQLASLVTVRDTMDAAGDDLEVIDGIITVLQQHLIETKELAERQLQELMMAQAVMQQQQQQAAAPVENGGSGSGESNRPPSENGIAPPTAGKMMQGMASAAGLQGMPQ